MCVLISQVPTKYRKGYQISVRAWVLETKLDPYKSNFYSYLSNPMALIFLFMFICVCATLCVGDCGGQRLSDLEPCVCTGNWTRISCKKVFLITEPFPHPNPWLLFLMEDCKYFVNLIYLLKYMCMYLQCISAVSGGQGKQLGEDNCLLPCGLQELNSVLQALAANTHTHWAILLSL